MKQKILNIKDRFLDLFKNNCYACLSFVLAFSLSYSLVWLSVSRLCIIANLKKEVVKIQESLYEFGYDIAYEGFETSAIYPFEIMSFKNFMIYSSDFSWQIENLGITSGKFNTAKIYIKLNGLQKLSFDKLGEYVVGIGEQHIELDFASRLGLQDVMIQIKNLDLKNFCKVDEIKIAARRNTPQQISDTTTFFNGHLEVSNLTFNGLVDYPLSQNISKIYANANIVGAMKDATTYKQSLNNWLQLNGFVDIKNFIINWEPLIMVGRGELNFDEKYNPKLRLSTSSKSLLELVDELQNKEIIESKGAFVAKILLSNKAFKNNEDDKEMTIITPIDYIDGKWSIEKITVRKKQL